MVVGPRLPGMPQEPTEDEAEAAAQEVIAADALLPGEQNGIRSTFWEDAQMWLEVYEELFKYKQDLLATLVEQRDRIRTEGQHEIQNDEILLTREADRLSRRLEFWQTETRRRPRLPT